ncbi:MAG: TldD/PmbA family protein [Candidatus Bipolaricaulota bacterium]|nr:TldD/PmbA family protein [Candidatus Bipolaricaulota bacterium]
MLGESRLAEIAQQVLRQAKADQTEVMVAGTDSHLTRFAVNTIHQNVSETDVAVRVRSILGRKTGVASGNELSEAALRKLVRSAETVAGFQEENPELGSLPGPKPAQKVDVFVERTAECTPVERARGVEKILKMSRKNQLDAAGAFSTEANETYIANSLGVSAYHRGTVASILTVIMGQNSSGYATAASIDVANLDPESVGRIAVEKALSSKNPTPIEPGEYTVILEEAAVADMLFTLGWMGLGALAVQEGRSFMNGKFGERITGEKVTIWDDGADPRGLPLPFDFEGVPKQKVTLIEKGVAKNVVYDSFTAGREEGKVSTGHSLPAPNTAGPIPLNLFMAPGKATKEEMLASTKRGIWVTRFHYTNILHPVQTILTGMTRDGTYLIENGKIVRPLRNLRFTQSILEAFSNIEALGKDLVLLKDEWNSVGTCAPAAKIRDFRFTGTTD